MKPVIFDMDGVVVDSEPLNDQHIEQFLIKIGVPEPVKVPANMRGMNARAAWTVLIEEFELEHAIEDLITDARASYLAYLEAMDPLPEIAGSKALIQQLHSVGVPLALASSANPRRVELCLRKLGLEQYFSVIVSSDDVQKSKPHPDIFLHAADKLQANPQDCIVIEDSQNGVRAAKAAGMKCIAYGGSDHNTDDLSEADVLVTDFALLLEPPASKHELFHNLYSS